MAKEPLSKRFSWAKSKPDHFGRDEAVAILREHYERLTGKVETKLHGAATGDDKK